MLSNGTTTKLSIAIRVFLLLSTIVTLFEICYLILIFYDYLVIPPFAIFSAVKLTFVPIIECMCGEASVLEFLRGLAGLVMILVMPFAAASVKKNGTILPAIALVIFAMDLLQTGYIVIGDAMDHYLNWMALPPFITDVLAVALLATYFLLRIRHKRKNDIS